MEPVVTMKTGFLFRLCKSSSSNAELCLNSSLDNLILGVAMTVINDAVEKFRSGFNCAQAIFSTYSKHFGLDPKLALLLTTAFGGGIARSGDLCGAVTGALMVIGLKHGKSISDDEDAKELTYALALDLIDSFKVKYGTIKCRELMGCDLSTEEGRQYAREHELSKNLCPSFVEYAAEMIENILEL